MPRKPPRASTEDAPSTTEPKEAVKRRPLPKFGVRGVLGTKGTAMRASTLVRAVLEDGYVRVLWTEGRVRRKESRPDTAPNREWARAFAEGVHEELVARASGAPATPTFAPITLRVLWEKYLTAHPTLRPTTRTNYLQRWQKLERFVGRQVPAHTLTRETLDGLVVALRKVHAPNQVREIVKTVIRVIRWGVDRDLLPVTKVAAYRVRLARGEGPREVAEYTLDEARRILAQFDPRDARGWRPYVATYVFAFAGPRQSATRHLTWDDVDLGTLVLETPKADPKANAATPAAAADGEAQPSRAPEGPPVWRIRGATIRWRAATDKMGRERVQPVPSGVAEALWLAYGWRLAMGYTGPYVLFRPAMGTRQYEADTGRWYPAARAAERAAAAAAAGADRPYSYAAYNRRLLGAEKAAQVPHLAYRAAHGFRRLVVGNLLERTGNLVAAGAYIGDTDLAVLRRSYVRERPEQLRELAEIMEDLDA